jgi:cell division control protein 7
VIKYDSSFQSGDLECFVLEHVEHDRPEVWHIQLTVMLFVFYHLRTLSVMARVPDGTS